MKAKQIISAAAAALAESVGLILDDNGVTEAEKRQELAESFAQAEAWLQEQLRDGTIAVDKAVSTSAKPGIEFDTADGTHLKFPNERALAIWLSAQERIRKSKSEENSMSTEQIEAARIAKLKSLNPVAIAKAMVEDNSSHGLTEHELVELITSQAVREHPGMSPAQAFEKAFTVQTEEGTLLRQAVAISKGTMSIEPMQTGGALPQRSGSSPRRKTDPADGLPTSAYGELQALVAEQRQRSPEMTPEQAFAAVYTANPELAARERQENRPAPTISFAFPR